MTGSEDDDQVTETIFGGRVRPPRWHPEHVPEAQSLGLSPDHPDMYRMTTLRQPVWLISTPALAKSGAGQQPQEES